MNDLVNFSWTESRGVRTLERDGEPWFVAKDVCDILEYKNSRDALQMLDDDEKMVVNLNNTVANGYGIIDGPGNPNMTIINESGLYHLIFQSKMPQAMAFRKWVTSEVLPSIRKTGQFVVKELQEKLHNMEQYHKQYRQGYHADLNYRLELLHLLDKLEAVFNGKRMKESEYYKTIYSFTHGKHVEAETFERLRDSLDCELSDIIEWGESYNRMIFHNINPI